MLRLFSRSGEAYGRAYIKLLPTGLAWPKDFKSIIGKFIRGLSEQFSRFDDVSTNFLNREAFPETAVDLLPDFERVVGLPDKCTGLSESIEERQQAVVSKLSARGGLSIPYFKEVARQLGYEIEIVEFQPLRYGVSRYGDTSSFYATEDIAFQWLVRVRGARSTWFRYGASIFGTMPQQLIRRADDLECRLNELKPDHTLLLFSYEGN